MKATRLVGASFAALACSAQPPPSAGHVSPSSALGAAPALPGPAQGGARFAERAPALNAQCEHCHPQIAAEWRSSLHHESFSNASFQSAFELEKLAFCQGCHAPEGDPRSAQLGALGELGVGCTSCHLTGSGVLAAPHAGGSAAPHAVLRSAGFGAAGACAGCHEFTFPNAVERRQTALMQSTLEEHRHSSNAAEPCASCHMPRAGADSHRSHAFTGSRDPAMLRRAVSVTARRVGNDRIEVSLTPAWVGHAFPTGDLFRRLRVSAELVGSDYQLLASDERFLARHFEREQRGTAFEVMTLKRDDRVGLAGDAPSRVALALGEGAADRPISWRVSYQRVAHPRGVDARDALLEADVEIAAGVLPPASEGSREAQR